MTPESIMQALDWMDYYRRLLEDIQDGRAVRDLQEAKMAYDRALDWLTENYT